MEIVKDPREFQKLAVEARCGGAVTGFIPTMGYFHEGHVSLMEHARARADRVFVSLFVNPTQFAPGEDLAAYPRDLERDADRAEAAGVDILFVPEPEFMYAPGAATWVEVPELARGLCAAARPTHFRGVATVVAKLLNLAWPTFAVFGRKDWQQLAIIRRMVLDLDFPVEIVGRPIVREADGLAMSSRNVYLSPEERAQAPSIHAGLRKLREWASAGELDSARLVERLRAFWAAEMPLGAPDYMEIVDQVSLAPLDTLRPGALAAVAVRFGRARLIDNLELEF